MELIIMFFVSIAPFILAFQSISQNHWIMTFMVESDQKNNLVQTHIQAPSLLHLPHRVLQLIALSTPFLMSTPFWIHIKKIQNI